MGFSDEVGGGGNANELIVREGMGLAWLDVGLEGKGGGDGEVVDENVFRG